MRLALLVVASLTLGGTAQASGFILIPPLEIDIGANAPVGAAQTTVSPSTELLVGVHWASLAWMPTRLDFGVGYVGSFRERYDTPTIEDELRIHGGYLTLGTTIANHRHWRTWVSARGELLVADDGEREISALGGAMRVATELFGSGAGGGNNAIVVGTFAIGIYAEATYRDVPAALGRFGLSSGLSVRIPLIVGG